MISYSHYKCLVLNSRENTIKYCKMVKVNPQYISEIVEVGASYVRCPEKIYDELLTFLSGKKIVLFEGVNVPKNKKHKRFEISYDDEATAGFFYVRVKTNMNKLIMSNGNQYYVIAE